MSELSRIFFQARDASDNPAVGADVYIIRRGASVDSGSTATSIKSKDPGCLYNGDVVRILRAGDVLEGTGAIELTLTADPSYDVTLKYWTIPVTYTEVWTPQDGDRLVLKETEEIQVYEDPEGEVAITQPTTIGALGTYEAWAVISGYDICIENGGNYEYVTSAPDTLRGFITPEDFGALGETFEIDSYGWQRALDFAHSSNTKVVRSLGKTYYTQDLKGRIGVHAYGGGYFSSPTLTYDGTVLSTAPTPPGVGVSEAVIAWRGNQGPGADWEDDRLGGFSMNNMHIKGLIADNRPVVFLEDCELFQFNNVRISSGGYNALKILGCWDARFNDIRVGESGTVTGTQPSIEIDDSASLESCNNLYFNDTVMEAYQGIAIGIAGTNPNEIVFNTVKIESTTSVVDDVSVQNATNIRFNGLQISALADKPTKHCIVFDNCNNCYGDIHVEAGSIVTLDHYVQLNSNCERNHLDVLVYGLDKSLNGTIGDDNPDENYIREIPVLSPLADNPQSTYPPSTIHRFAAESSPIELEMVRKDYPTAFHLGQIVQDGASASGLWKFLADSNLAFSVNKDGDLTIDGSVLGDLDLHGTLKNTSGSGYVDIEPAWDDVLIPFQSVKVPATGAPNWEQIQTGIWAYHFLAGNSEEAYFTAQLPHGYVEGTDLKPHLHWISGNNDTGTVTFEFDYIIQNVNGIYPSKVTTTTTINAPGSTGNHTIFTLPTISGTTPTPLNVSSVIIGTIRRRGDTDTHTGKVAAISLDFHVQVNSIGSDLEFTKT